MGKVFINVLTVVFTKGIGKIIKNTDKEFGIVLKVKDL